LVVQGPNRFWYTLSGGVGSPDVAVAMLPGSRALNLELVNDGASAVVVTVRSRRYGRRSQEVRLRPRQRKQLAWATEHGWYDVEVSAAGGFYRSLTGRLENGRAGVSG
jgi:phospholipase C